LNKGLENHPKNSKKARKNRKSARLNTPLDKKSLIFNKIQIFDGAENSAP
jgi:hypothetical protein